MIKKYIEKLFGRRERVTHKDAKPVVYPKEKHGIGREHISRCARKTCEELQRAGYLAFVVGGAVRDLLLGFRPKDFDVATSATPEEVRAVFRRSRIIGRRFQIVHVLCGADMVEVSTFRAHFTREATEDNTDEHGRSLHRTTNAICILWGRQHTPELANQMAGERGARCEAYTSAVLATWNGWLRPYTRIDTGNTF